MAKLAKAGPLPAIVLAVLIAITIAFHLQGLFVLQNPDLSLALNIIFLSGTSFVVVFISANSFLKNGLQNILILSNALLVGGLAALVAGLAGLVSANYNNTIYNMGICVSAGLQLLSAVVTAKGLKTGATTKIRLLLAASFVCSTLFVVVLSLLTLNGLIPVFLIGTAPTLLRQTVTGLAAFLFALSALVFGWQYYRAKSQTIFWYIIALGLFALGLSSAFAVQHSGDALTWLAKLSVFAGGFYFLLTVLSARGVSAEDAETNISLKWAEAFRSDREQMETFFSKIAEGFAYCKIITDKEGKPIDWLYLDVNKSYEQVNGVDKDHIIGRKVTDVIPNIQKDPADWIGLYGRVALTEEPMIFERFSEDRKKWYHISAYSPKKSYFVSIFEDITERKNAEKEIAGLAKFPLENPAAVLRVNRQGTVMFANPPAQSFLKEWQTKVGEPIPERILRMVVDSMASNNKAEFEEKLGEEIFSFLITPIVSEGYANLYGRAITKRKKAEEKLAEYAKNLEAILEERTRKLESKSLYARSLLEASLDPLVTINSEGKITDVNNATEYATGCSREELIGSDFSTYFTEPEKASAGYKQVFTNGFVKDYPLAIKHKSGKVTEVLYNATTYRDAEGQVQGVFAAARDITQRKMLEKRLKESERLATIGATAGMVGHDIRNPLQAITSDVYLLRSELASLPEGETKQNMNESLDGISENVEYVNKIVQDLQDYARPITLSAKEIRLDTLCEDVLFKNVIPDNIEALCEVDREVRIIVTDPEVLKRILSNLISNAFQAMPNGGKIVLHAYGEADGTVISIQDSGEGIPEEARPKLFTPLFTTKSKGQGFGLAVVKRLTESLGGEVSFESEIGKGTTFTVRLPTGSKRGKQ